MCHRSIWRRATHVRSDRRSPPEPGRAAPKKAISLSWSDPRVRNIVWQVVIIGAVVAIVWYLAANTSRNLEARHIATGFGFLFQSPASRSAST